MLVLETDPDGIDIIPSKDVVLVKPNDLAVWCKKPKAELPPIMCVTFNDKIIVPMNGTYCPPAEEMAFNSFTMVVNLLLYTGCPWTMVVVDTTTSLQDIIYRHLSKTNNGQLSDPRKWAASIGMKVKEIIARLFTLPATHVGVLMHSSTKENETTGTIRTEPKVYSQVRDEIPGICSQFFYQDMNNGKPRLLTKDNGFIKGVGARWPANLPAECGVTFKEVYETIYPNPK